MLGIATCACYSMRYEGCIPHWIYITCTVVIAKNVTLLACLQAHTVVHSKHFYILYSSFSVASS